jgi:hypothetical protein
LSEAKLEEGVFVGPDIRKLCSMKTSSYEDWRWRRGLDSLQKCCY